MTEFLKNVYIALDMKHEESDAIGKGGIGVTLQIPSAPLFLEDLLRSLYYKLESWVVVEVRANLEI